MHYLTHAQRKNGFYTYLAKEQNEGLLQRMRERCNTTWLRACNELRNQCTAVDKHDKTAWRTTAALFVCSVVHETASGLTRTQQKKGHVCMCERDATNKAERIQQKAERGPAREIYNIICLNAKKKQGSSCWWCRYKQAQGCNTSLKHRKRKEWREIMFVRGMRVACAWKNLLPHPNQSDA